MCRLFGYVGNDPSLLPLALQESADALVEECEVPGEGWGMGFYQEDRPLVRKRPKLLMERVEFATLMDDLRSRSLIGQLRRGSRGEVSSENTPPFRFRNWLFANQGEIAFNDPAHVALRERLPDFLQRNVRGQTDSEPALHLFFDLLRQRTQIENPIVPKDAIIDTVRALTQEINAMMKATDQERPPEFNLLYLTGRILIAVQHQSSVPLAFRRIEGLTQQDQPLFAGHKPRAKEHPHYKGVFVAFDPHGDAPEWEQVPPGSILLVDDRLNVSHHPIDPSQES